MSPWDWSSAQSLSLKKPQNFRCVPVPHERRTVASSFVCTAVSLCGEALLFPALPPGRPPSRPASLPTARQTSASLDECELLTALFDKGGGVEKFVRFVSDSWEWLSRFRGALKFGGQQIFISLLVGWGCGTFIPVLLVCAPDETEGNLQVPDWVCKFCVFVHGFPLFFPNRESNPGWQCKLWGRQVGENKNWLKK